MRKFIFLFILSSLLTFANKEEKVEKMLTDVMKTDNQLIPKLCRYIVITDIDKKELELAKNSIKLGILANSTTDDINIFINSNQNSLDDLTKYLKNLNQDYTLYNNENDLIDMIMNIKKDSNHLRDKRILVITSSKKMRKNLARLINVIDDKDLILDNFAYLYNTNRHEYETITDEQIKEIYKEININKGEK